MPKEPHDKQHDLRGAALVRVGKRLRARAKEIATCAGCKHMPSPERLKHPPIDHSVTTYILQIVAQEIEEEGKESSALR